MPPRLITFAVKFTGTTRRVIHDELSYLVAPAVIVQAGVMNGELLPPHELELFPAMWDGIPVTLRHPLNNESANIPEPSVPVLGRLFASHWVPETQRIISEVWLDDDLVVEANGGPEVVARIEAGDIVNVSTGYFRVAIEKPGIYKQKTYRRVQSDLKPDHLALLPDEMGACSVDDGCGIPRANSGNSGEGRLGAFNIFSKEKPMNVLLQLFLNAARDLGLITLAEAPEGQPIPVTQVAATPVAPPVVPVAAQAAPCAGAAQNTTPTAEPVVEPDPDDEQSELAELAEEFGGIDGLRELLRAASGASTVADNAAQVAQVAIDEIVARLVENTRCTIPEADLQVMSLAGLQALENTFGIVANFAPLGARVAPSTNEATNAPPAVLLAAPKE